MRIGSSAISSSGCGAALKCELSRTYEPAPRKVRGAAFSLMSMQASGTSHPAAEELMAYGDGEALASVAAHVSACSTGTEQVSSYARIQVELRRPLFRFDCPGAHTLGEYQLDLLAP